MYRGSALSSSSTLRVAMLSGDFYPEQVGGQGIYAFEVATRAARLGVDVTVVCPARPGRVDYVYTEGLKVRFLPGKGGNVLSYTASVSPLLPTLVDRADVLHVNDLFGFTAPLARKDRGLVISSHNSYLDRFRAAKWFKKVIYPPLLLLERLSYPRADRLIIGSEIEREPVRRLGVEDERIVMIPYGVDVDGFFDADGSKRRAVRAQLGIPEDAEVALFVGRFVERKKPHVTARAFRALCQERPGFHGILIGDGEMMSSVRAISDGEPRLHFTGAVPFSGLAQYYAAADVFTLPSVGEGSISLVVLEAAAAGLPLVLTADSCGQSEVFEAGRNGELVQLGDANDLAQGLRRALERRDAYGKRSREIVVKRFSWDVCARATVRCYEDVARARRR